MRMLILGEVHTGLLQHSTSLPSPLCRHILDLVHGEPVRQFERPIAYTTSPDLLAGVDCHLPTSSGAKVRGIGTVVHRAALTGGHVLQGSAVVRVGAGKAGNRLPWPHYLARPGEVETIGGMDRESVARGFVAPRAGGKQPGPLLDLGAICGRLMDNIQASPELDRMPPFRMQRTRLRWVAVVPAESGGAAGPEPAGAAGTAGAGATAGTAGAGAAAGTALFTIESEQLRTLRLPCGPDQAEAVAHLCEDLALHDWLLTTLAKLVDRSRIGTGSQQPIERLRPAIDHLLHLWMPGARVDPSVLEVWNGLEQRPGFSRQWRAMVDRIRDQLALRTLTLLATRSEPSVSAL